MRQRDISNALTTRLDMAPALGLVVWENQEAQPSAPYLVFENVRTTTEDATLAGGGYTARGYIQVTVIHKLDAFAVGAEDIADDLAARFPYGLRLACIGGQVLVTKPPHIGQGFPDGVFYRVPVRIDYMASGL